ncbi:uncharacterized protein LOC142556884 [Primulina tabacum]|uniref:uncharacterized protein LOC142556884 n=1 Tax=Primulina tabacum TaxID=48773 RepID=UPI003F59AFE9
MEEAQKQKIESGRMERGDQVVKPEERGPRKSSQGHFSRRVPLKIIRDREGFNLPHNDALVIQARVANYDIMRVFLDSGSSVNVIFKEAFAQMDLQGYQLEIVETSLFGFAGHALYPEEEVVLPLTLGAGELKKTELTEISPLISEHHLNILLGSHPVKQKKRHFGPEKDKVIDEHVRDLLKVGYIREIQFPTWLSNVVLVPSTPRSGECVWNFGTSIKLAPKITIPCPRLINCHLAELPVLVKPGPEEKLFVYFSTTEYAVSSILIKKEGSDQRSDYYVSHYLRGPKLQDSEVEKIALALVITARKLRPYFLSHQIIVLINSPLERIMTHAELSVRMIKWAVELGEYDIEYKPRVAIKAQALSDFLSEMVQPNEEEVLRVFVDGASSLAGCGVGVLITQQIKGVYEVKDDLMLKYLQLIKAQSEVFVDWSIEQYPGRRMMKQMLWRSFQGPLLKCLPTGEVDYVLREIHEGFCGEHLGGISLARTTMLAGCRWPTISQNSARVWGMENVAPFPIARAQKKFLLVPVDYFSKWLEADPLAKITGQEVLKFLWKNIVCRFGVPRRLISDNRRQFQGREITSWCREMKITQSFTSVAYPQANDRT